MFDRSDVLLSFLNVCVYLVVVVNCQSCEENGPVYMYGSSSLTCKNITGQFPAWTKSVTSMKCLDCNIPVLDENTITGNFRGDTFNLSYSHVQAIKGEAFGNFTNNTHKLLFNNNDINSISKKSFSEFAQLDDLNLKSNNLSTLEDGTFEGTAVSTLDLSHNNIDNITGAFRGLKVTKLNLSSNGIVEIPQNAFDDTIFWTGRQWRTGFQMLDLSNNFIYKIIPGTFKSPNSENLIRSLYLQKNMFTVIENNTFSKLTYLKFLSLEHNAISKLYSDSFKGLTSLTSLSLKSNYIRKIPSSMFADLRNLEVLDLSSNELSAFSMDTFSGLVYLSKLNVSHNNLRVLDDTHLFPLGRLVTLDVSDTKLHDLNLHTIFEHHYKLRNLVINDNFWTCKHLVQMYKQMNERIGGFDYPSRYFNVPNLHGIACSRVELDSYDDMNFDDFLGIISQDRVFEDLFDSRINQADLSVDDVSATFQHIDSIYHMMLVLTIVILIIFVQFVFRCIIACLYRRNMISSDRFSFAYNPNQDDVKLL